MQVVGLIVTAQDPVDDFYAPHRTDPAGRAFPAGLDGAELHGEAGLLAHVHGIVKDYEASVADHAVDIGERFVVQGRVELRRMDVGAQRPAGLHRPDRPAGGRTTAEVLQQFAQRAAEADLHQPAPLDVAGQLHGERPSERPVP